MTGKLPTTCSIMSALEQSCWRKAYDADRIRASLREKGAFVNIPPKSNRRSKPYFSTWLYRERNLIERFFSKLKHFRRVATRYNKLAAIFLSGVALATALAFWL